MGIKGLGPKAEISKEDASKVRILIVHSRWNYEVIEKLLNGALDTLAEKGVTKDNIHIESVPGGWELPISISRLISASQVIASKEGNLGDLLSTESVLDAPAETKQPQPFDVAIAIGTIIKGDTDHDKYIANSVSTALMNIQLSTGVPVIFGVLTTNNDEQALQRAGVNGHNHGEDWALAAVEMAVKTTKWAKNGI